MKFEFIKVEDAADKWVPYMNNKHVLSGGYWILFLNTPLKFELDKVKGRC
jgi:hypothetical protein